jgi:hypothetical protein
METVQAIKESGVAPEEFWYLSTLILTGLLILFLGTLIIFVKGFFTKLQTTMDKFSESMQQLATMVKLHDLEIKNAKEDIIDLQKRRR